jgi:predicted ABC-type ATPase
MPESLKPTLVTLAGPNGAGKTTLTNLIKNHVWLRDCHYINPDDIRYEMARAAGVDPETAEMNIRAANEADRRREDLLARREGIAFETVFSSQGKLDFLRRASEAGYFIRLFFVGTADPEINVRRVGRRVTQGGHAVPDQKIRDRYYRSLALYAQAAKFVDRSYAYDNSDDIDVTGGTNYMLPIIFRTRQGVVVKAYRPYPAWTLPIVKGLLSGPDVASPKLDADASPPDLGGI